MILPISARPPLVDYRPIMNAVKYWVVSGVVWTNRTMVSSNTNTNRTGILVVVDIGISTVAERLDCSPPTKANRVQSPAGPLPDFRKWESCRTMLLIGGFSLGYPVSSTIAFRLCSILTSFRPNRLSRALSIPFTLRPTVVPITSVREHSFNHLNSAGMNRRGIREVPEKTRRPSAASSETKHAFENPGVARPGIEPGSQRAKNLYCMKKIQNAHTAVVAVQRSKRIVNTLQTMLECSSSKANINLQLNDISTTHEDPPSWDDPGVLAADWLTSSVVRYLLLTSLQTPCPWSPPRLRIVQSGGVTWNYAVHMCL
ncbi:hypothetical protein PR048_003578 [Dryococelus australis]|uniref:Uncharacterized protein n=1 Tax=Dryococelus australis TaxID=614101 RepID=A0ABQ9ING0_9NEOP|nr:hypothetical protein PR048_003578 [Dryococelus australis]